MKCSLSIATLLIASLGSAPGGGLAAESNKGADVAAARDATFDDIKLDLEKDQPYKPSLLTDKVKKLDGRSIKIRGYILPSYKETGIKQFILVRDNMECCFGPGAALHDCIVVEMEGDATASYTVRPVSVEGKFSVKVVEGADGKTLAIYRLDAKTVK